MRKLCRNLLVLQDIELKELKELLYPILVLWRDFMELRVLIRLGKNASCCNTWKNSVNLCSCLDCLLLSLKVYRLVDC